MDLFIYILKILGIAGGLAAAFFIFRNWKRIVTFLEEVLAEIKKVSWTPRKDLINATWIVLISAICLGLFITATDLLLSRGMHVLIK